MTRRYRITADKAAWFRLYFVLGRVTGNWNGTDRPYRNARSWNHRAWLAGYRRGKKEYVEEGPF